jgi:predicted MFS family arabinose efflux permease
MLRDLSPDVRQYLLITGNYWAFTLTDGALRMLVVLYFHQLGYAPLEVALLFLFYEFFGVVTNLFGGWIGARIGLHATMNAGLSLQVIALAMLLVPASMLTIAWVMAAQALSGIAKDLNKMSAKSAIKLLVPAGAESRLYRWVALLTGSKNTLKGMGFFLGGFLLSALGFAGAVLAMALVLSLVWVLSMLRLKSDLGRASNRPKFRQLFSKSRAVNILSAARLFLFAARDVWFVVALPVYLSATLGWNYSEVGAYLALWVIGYGAVQALAPRFTSGAGARPPDGRNALGWALALAGIPALIALALSVNVAPSLSLLAGLAVFGVVFAINSALHSYLIVSYAQADGVSLDVGFYYMANATGRLAGTVLSGWIFQNWGLAHCLVASTLMVGVCAVISVWLPRHPERQPATPSASA